MFKIRWRGRVLLVSFILAAFQPGPPSSPAAETPVPTAAPTAIPISNFKVLREVIPDLEAGLPIDAVCIQIGNQGLANHPEQSSFDLAQAHWPDGTMIGATQVQVALDGSAIAYVVLDRLVIDQLSRGERWIYQREIPKQAFLWLTAPQFSPDASSLVYSAVLNNPIGGPNAWGLIRIDLSTGSEEILLHSDDLIRPGDSSPAISATGHLTRVSRGGAKELAFIPSAWTAWGILGRWMLPFTDARASEGWLLDPNDGEMHHRFQEGL